METDTIYKIFKNSLGEELVILYDNDPINPMEYDDGVINYYTWRTGYQSIEDNDFVDPEDWYDSIMGEGSFYRQIEQSQKNLRSELGFAKDLCHNLDRYGIFALPILCYEHSLIKYYIGDSLDYFDGSIAGFAWAYKRDLYKEYNIKRLSHKSRANIEKKISKTLNVYSEYVNGNAYGFTFTDCNGEEDSCWGFLGYDSDEEMLNDMIQNLGSDVTDFVEVVHGAQKLKITIQLANQLQPHTVKMC